MDMRSFYQIGNQALSHDLIKNHCISHTSKYKREFLALKCSGRIKPLFEKRPYSTAKETNA